MVVAAAAAAALLLRFMLYDLDPAEMAGRLAAGLEV
jgi:hypothetical protein